MSSGDQDFDKLRRTTVEMAAQTSTSRDETPATLDQLTSEARAMANDTHTFLANLGEKAAASIPPQEPVRQSAFEKFGPL